MHEEKNKISKVKIFQQGIFSRMRKPIEELHAFVGRFLFWKKEKPRTGDIDCICGNTEKFPHICKDRPKAKWERKVILYVDIVGPVKRGGHDAILKEYRDWLEGGVENESKYYRDHEGNLILERR